MRPSRWFCGLFCIVLLLLLIACAPVPIAKPIQLTPAPPAASATPKPTALPLPTPEPALVYAFNPYVLPSDAKAYLGINHSAYEHLVDAVILRQDKVVFEDDSMIPAVSCFYAEFPLSSLLSDYEINRKEHTLLLTYSYAPEEHTARIKDFQKRVETIIRSTIKPSYNDLDRALVLYRWTAQNILYIDGEDVSPYNAMMNGVGICQSYDGVYQFLLLQVGIDCLSGGAFMTDDAAHAWSLVPINDHWFHMDPTFENSDNGGDGLRYFGMDEARRLDSGVLLPIGIGIDGWNAPAPPCEDNRFQVLTSVTRWEFESNAHRIALYYEGDSQPSAIFDTSSYELLDF